MTNQNDDSQHEDDQLNDSDNQDYDDVSKFEMRIPHDVFQKLRYCEKSAIL